MKCYEIDEITIKPINFDSPMKYIFAYDQLTAERVSQGTYLIDLFSCEILAITDSLAYFQHARKQIFFKL